MKQSAFRLLKVKGLTCCFGRLTVVSPGLDDLSFALRAVYHLTAVARCHSYEFVVFANCVQHPPVSWLYSKP
jgi:hypothetical protein